jgi:hypothetical protein
VPKADILRCGEDWRYSITSSAVANSPAWGKALGHVRFGSLADIEALPFDVRFTPKSGHPSHLAGSRLPEVGTAADLNERGVLTPCGI